MPSDPNARRNEHIRQLRHLLNAGQIRSALVHINQLGPYRFTALYRFDTSVADNPVLVDKRSGILDRFPDASIDASYRAFVRSLRKPFFVQDALVDLGLEGDAAGRRVVRSYCGVPLLGEDAEPVGTLCQFDFDPVPSSAPTLALMRMVSGFMTAESARHALSVDLHRQLDSLEEMLDLIVTASSSDAQRQQSFEEMAAHLRIQAEGLDAHRLQHFRRHLLSLSEQMDEKAGRAGR